VFPSPSPDRASSRGSRDSLRDSPAEPRKPAFLTPAAVAATSPASSFDIAPSTSTVTRAVTRDTTPRATTPSVGATHADATSLGTADPPGNLVVFTSPSGGIGTSTLMALTGVSLTSRGVECALLDADLDGGGLDVLLGIEHEPGLSLQDLDAPLGHIDGAALNREVPEWEGMRVLAHTPWRGSNPQWWELEAAADALAEANDIVLADVGRGTILAHMPRFAAAHQVVVVDLSVLGMARAKSHVATLDRMRDAALGTVRNALRGDPRSTPRSAAHGLLRNRRHGHDRADITDIEDPPIMIGVEPRGVARKSPASSVAVEEAVAYLGEDVLGPLRCTPSLCADILAGLGIRAVPKRNRRAVDALGDGILEGVGIRAPNGRRRP